MVKVQVVQQSGDWMQPPYRIMMTFTVSSTVILYLVITVIMVMEISMIPTKMEFIVVWKSV